MRTRLTGFWMVGLVLLVPGVAAEAEQFSLEVPGNLAALHLGVNRFVVAQIDGQGRLHFFVSGPAGWDHAEAPSAERLVPGAPLALVADPRSERPLVYTVDGQGRVVEIADGRRIRRVTQAASPAFPPGGHLTVLDQGPTELGSRSA